MNFQTYVFIKHKNVKATMISHFLTLKNRICYKRFKFTTVILIKQIKNQIKQLLLNLGKHTGSRYVGIELFCTKFNDLYVFKKHLYRRHNKLKMLPY